MKRKCWTARGNCCVGCKDNNNNTHAANPNTVPLQAIAGQGKERKKQYNIQ